MPNKNDYLEMHAPGKKSKNLRLSETEWGDDALVEYMISTWSINPKGFMCKEKEVSFEFPGKFSKSSDQKTSNTTLVLSHNSKVVSLSYVNENNRLCLWGWKTSNLKPFPYNA